MALSREHDFAFVLLDVQIPTLDGFTLAELMRGTERSSATPIVLLTAASPDAPLPVFRGFDSAAVDVLFKPVNPDLLRQKAKLFVEFYRQKQDLARALRAREDVLAIVSHDMRTPLSVVTLMGPPQRAAMALRAAVRRFLFSISIAAVHG